MVIAAAAVFLAALVGELGNFTTRSASAISQSETPSAKSLKEVETAKTNIEQVKATALMQDQTLQDPAEACRDRAKALAKDRGRAKFAWADTVRVSRTRKIKTTYGNPAFLVSVKADSEKTYCAVIFQNSSCKIDMLNCSEEQKTLQVARFGKLAAK